MNKNFFNYLNTASESLEKHKNVHPHFVSMIPSVDFSKASFIFNDGKNEYKYDIVLKEEDDHIVIKVYDPFYTVTDDPVNFKTYNKILKTPMIRATFRHPNNVCHMAGGLLGVRIGERHKEVLKYDLFTPAAVFPQSNISKG